MEREIQTIGLKEYIPHPMIRESRVINSAEIKLRLVEQGVLCNDVLLIPREMISFIVLKEQIVLKETVPKEQITQKKPAVLKEQTAPKERGNNDTRKSK